jgi:DNA recombination-dependent growth factor C
MSNKTKPDPLQQNLAGLERAVYKLMPQFQDTEIHGFVNCIMAGWIRNGQFTPEYIAAAREAELKRQEEDAAEARARAVRESISGSSIGNRTTSAF